MTELIKPSRRSFLSGLASLVVAAPAIVKASSLMPVKSILTAEELLMLRMQDAYDIMRRAITANLYEVTWVEDGLGTVTEISILNSGSGSSPSETAIRIIT